MSLAKLGKVALFATFLALPVYAVASLAAPAGGPTVQLAAEDDPVLNGMRILDTPPTADSRPALQRDDASAEVVLDNWTFTSKGKPSPYH